MRLCSLSPCGRGSPRTAAQPSFSRGRVRDHTDGCDVFRPADSERRQKPLTPSRETDRCALGRLALSRKGRGARPPPKQKPRSFDRGFLRLQFFFSYRKGTKFDGWLTTRSL